MLLLFVFAWTLMGELFAFVSSPEPIIWAGALVGQGFYSGGRLVANAVASGNGKVFKYLRNSQAPHRT